MIKKTDRMMIFESMQKLIFKIFKKDDQKNIANDDI